MKNLFKICVFLVLAAISLFVGGTWPWARGLVREYRKNYPAALTDYDSVIGKFPQMAISYINRAGVKNETGDYKGAVEDATTALEKKAILFEKWKKPLAYFNRCKAELHLKHYKEAIADCMQAENLLAEEKGRLIQGFMFKISLNKGTALDEMGNKKGALLEYTRAIELLPEAILIPPTDKGRAFSDAYTAKGRAQLAKDRKSARQDFEKAIELCADNPKPYSYRAMFKRDDRDYKGSLADITRAIELSQQEPAGDVYSYYQFRARLKRMLGDNKGALEDEKEAQRLKNHK